jgi:NADH-quinone oxidoreductase subunit M
MQFEEFRPWMFPPVNYHLGVDGLSALMILLTGFLTPLSVLVSWNGITQRTKEFFIFLLALETGMMGVFASLDLVLFFVFWEVMLIPMYFLIGIWGHERRVYAAIKFVLFTMVGSALMLTGIIYLYNITGTFDLPRVLNHLVTFPRFLRKRNAGSFWPSSLPLPSRFPFSPSTPGCPMRTLRRPRRAPSSWQVFS